MGAIYLILFFFTSWSQDMSSDQSRANTPAANPKIVNRLQDIDIPSPLRVTGKAAETLPKIDTFLSRYLDFKNNGKLGPRSPNRETILAILSLRATNCKDDRRACRSLSTLAAQMCFEINPAESDIERKIFEQILGATQTMADVDHLWQEIRSCSKGLSTGKFMWAMETFKLAALKNWSPVLTTITNYFMSQISSVGHKRWIFESAIPFIHEDIGAERLHIKPYKNLYSFLMSLSLTNDEMREVQGQDLNRLLMNMGRLMILTGEHGRFMTFLERYPVLSDSKDIVYLSAQADKECAYWNTGRFAQCKNVIESIRKQQNYSLDQYPDLELKRALVLGAVGQYSEAETLLKELLASAKAKNIKLLVPWIYNVFITVETDARKLKEASSHIADLDKSLVSAPQKSIYKLYAPLTKLHFYVVNKDSAKARSIITLLESQMGDLVDGHNEILAWTLYYKMFLAFEKGERVQGTATYEKFKAVASGLPEYAYLLSLGRELQKAGMGKYNPATDLSSITQVLGAQHPYVRTFNEMVARIK